MAARSTVSWRAPAGLALLLVALVAALHQGLAAERPSVALAASARVSPQQLIDRFLQQGEKLTGSGAGASFGASVALSADGDTALIGDPSDDGAGAAWVFTRSGSTWIQQGEKLTGAGESGKGEFGASVALSADGETALIGGPGDDGHVGAAWVFTRSGSTWTQQGEKLTGGEEIGGGYFGSSVALSADGETALIGAVNDDNFGLNAQGAAWVFSRSGSTWTQQGEKLTPNGGCGTPMLGYSVALSADGDTALVGAPLDCDVGAVWVFARSGSTWTQQGEKLTGGGESGKGWFGEGVALSADGETALIGGGYDDHGAGAAWVFARSGSTWTQQGEKLTAGGECAGTLFGSSVALSGEGDTALVGGSDHCDEGAAWAFERAGSTWTRQGEELTGSGESGEGAYGLERAGFGRSLALSADGETALIGGGRASQLLGAAWVFVNQPSSPPSPAEYGRCIRVPRVKGEPFNARYANANCTRTGESGSYEWYRGVDRTHFTSQLTEGAARFETVNGARVRCATEAGTGEYSGADLSTVGGVVLTFTGCELHGQACSSATAAQGEISTNQLEGVLGITALGETSVENEIGLALFPAGKAGLFTEFSCGATRVSIRGSLIGSLSANRMKLTSRLSFSASKGRQEPEGFVGEPSEILEASFDEGPFEPLALKLKASQTNEEALEVSSRP